MPAFNVAHLQTILNLACAKAQVPLNRKGLGKLAARINDQYRPDDVDIDQRYLDEHLKKPLEKALTTGETEVSMGQDRADKLCDFIGYGHMDSFKATWKQLDAFIPPKSNQEQQTSFQIFYDHSEERVLAPLLAASAYVDQSINHHTNIFQRAPTAAELEQILNTGFGVLLLSEDWLTEEVKLLLSNWLLDSSNRQNICLLWMEPEETTLAQLLPKIPEKLALLHEHLPLVVQRFQLLVEEGKKQESTQKHTGNHHIENSGATFYGNTSIQGEYISNRDMHINLTNKK